MIAGSRVDETYVDLVRERAAIARKTDSAPAHTVCPWCPEFDPCDPAIAGASHGLCDACAARLNAEVDRREASQSSQKAR